MFRGMQIRAANICFVGHGFAIFLVPLHGSVAKAKRKSGIRWLGESALGKTRLSDQRSITTYDGVDLVVVLCTDSAGIWVDSAHDNNQRIGAGRDCCRAAFIELLTEGDVVEFGIRDQILSGILWCSAVEHFLDVRMILAQCILHFGQGIGEKNLVKILVDRFGGKQLLLEGVKSGVAILSQA